MKNINNFKFYQNSKIHENLIDNIWTNVGSNKIIIYKLKSILNNLDSLTSYRKYYNVKTETFNFIKKQIENYK